MGSTNVVRAGLPRMISAGLGAILLLAGCGAEDQPGDQPDGTESATAQTGYTIEQVESALWAIDTGDSPQQVTAEPSPGPDTEMERHYQMLIDEAEVEPAECAQEFRERMQFDLEALRTPKVSTSADESRLVAGAEVLPDAQAAREAGHLGVSAVSEPCRKHTVIAPEDVRSWRYTESSTRTTVTPFEVDLPEAAEGVSAATVETYVFDIPVPYTLRRSSVRAVVDNVVVHASYGAPHYVEDPEQVPVLAERAAAERAVRQAVTELVGSG